MYNYVKLIEKRITEESKRFLDDIYEPTEVYSGGLIYAWRDLCVMRDGRIRYYSTYNVKCPTEDIGERECFYVESCDGGISWSKHFMNKNALGSSIYVPFIDKYISTKQLQKENTLVFIGNDPDDENPQSVKISDKAYIDLKQPFVMKSRNRIIVAAHERRPKIHETAYFPVIFYSDDGGKTWNETHPGDAPLFEKKWPHKGMRWEQNNREMTITELSDGTLLMITRTATDFHYMSRSCDGGETWSDFEPSPFHSTGTMPILKKLSDGRILFFWNNTKLLPEISGADGIWEDVFTNRDVCHCAISEDDGKTWKGFRELRLNPYRNAADFRSVGGAVIRDKSVHQFEALELPNGKILFVNGQSPVCCKIYIFDINWLYETERHEDFLQGMTSLSTHLFVKSVLGGWKGNGYAGHCAYNRTDGAYLVPCPENNGKEALLIRRVNDDILVSGICGAVWNFPIAQKGKIKIRAFIQGKGLRVSLLDYWMNPCDDTVEYYADMSVVLRGDMQPEGETFSEFVIEFDCNIGKTVLYCGDYLRIEKNFNGTHPFGLCYLHMQSVATEEDLLGAYVSEIDFKADTGC